MTTPPLPASPCLKVNLDYTQSDGYEGGSRFYLGYSGSAPTGANCITLAGDIEAAWLAHLAGLSPTPAKAADKGYPPAWPPALRADDSSAVRLSVLANQIIPI